MNKTSIEWTDFTWNPIRARNTRANRTGTFCTRISPGCKNCYASVINRRFGTGLEYDAQELKHHEFFLSETILAEPLKRKKPARIFVGDMFDLFHDAIPGTMIAEVLRVAYKLPRHTFQFLTKRADRMQRITSLIRDEWGDWQSGALPAHMHFGVSVEDQQRANERIPFLQATPVAVQFLSVEPQLEEVTPDLRAISWVICGGESGPGARPFNLAWAESLLAQCRAAGVPFFMKQAGAVPMIDDQLWRQCCAAGRVPLLAANNAHKVPANTVALRFQDRKGGDPAEWPEHLRVREFPAPKSTFEAEIMRCSQ